MTSAQSRTTDVPEHLHEAPPGGPPAVRRQRSRVVVGHRSRVLPDLPAAVPTAGVQWAQHHPLVHRLHAAVAHDDLGRAEAVTRVLLSEGCTLVVLFDDVLRPLVRRLHEANGAGSFEVRRTGLLLAALVSRLRDSAVRQPGAAVAFACSGPSTFLDSYMLAAVLEADGWRTTHLTALCLQDVDELAHVLPAPRAVVLAVDGTPVPELRDYCRRLHVRLPGVPVVALGPRAATQGVAQLSGVDVSADSIGAAARLVERLAAPLSDRELTILSHVSRGLTNKQVASLTDLAPSTVKSHLDRIFTKLGCPDRAAAVAHALRAGWID